MPMKPPAKSPDEYRQRQVDAFIMELRERGVDIMGEESDIRIAALNLVSEVMRDTAIHVSHGE